MRRRHLFDAVKFGVWHIVNMNGIFPGLVTTQNWTGFFRPTALSIKFIGRFQPRLCQETPLNWIAVDKGYVHKSRRKKIEEFATVGKAKEEGNNRLSITGKGFSVTFTSQKFDETKHKITKKKDKSGYEEYVIDGKTGAGIYLPNTHYKSITVTINGKNVPIPKSAYDDLYDVCLFEPNYRVYYDKEDDIFYIVGTLGNDSYTYEVCWKIEKGAYKTRLIGQSL